MPDRLTPDQRNAYISALLAWAMDAFDYFMLLLVMSNIEHDHSFGATPTQLAFVTTATLAMRPFGALAFGKFQVGFREAVQDVGRTFAPQFLSLAADKSITQTDEVISHVDGGAHSILTM